MRILALDHGEARIGLAISDELALVAQPLAYVPAKDQPRAAKQIVDLCRERGVGGIVIGLPLSPNGGENQTCANVRMFAEKLVAAGAPAVVFADERLTTRQATRVLIEADMSRRKRREKVDSLAAVILLQTYLDTQDPLNAG